MQNNKRSKSCSCGVVLVYCLLFFLLCLPYTLCTAKCTNPQYERRYLSGHNQPINSVVDISTHYIPTIIISKAVAISNANSNTHNHSNADDYDVLLLPSANGAFNSKNK